MAKASTSKRSVLDERFLKCGVCNERFWDNSKLIKHMESHSETEQLLCTICNKTFSAVQDLDKHYTLHIQLMQPYGCPACESRFVTQHQLMTHVENIHPELTIGEKSSPKEQQPSETSRRNSPRSSKPHLIIKQVPPVLEKSGKTVPPQPKKEKVKPSEQSSQESTAKKSILKVAPTPSGKKKPVIWKDPIVSPDKTLQGNVVSVKQSLAEKRKLVDAPVASSDAKKLKIVASATVGESAATPIRKTPVTKTKLMQSISKLYDKQTPSERKSLAQTRKDLLNALTITPVTKGPIRVLRTTKPFIVFSQSKDAADEVKRDIVHNSTTSSNVVQGKVKTAPGASQDFDKLLVSKTPPCVEKSDIKKVQQGLKVSSIQLISIKTPPGLTIQATSPGNSTIAKSEKSEKECAAASPARSTKLLQPIFPAGKLPQVIRIIPQNSPLLKPVPSSPVKTNVSPANSAQTVSVTLVKSPKSVVVAGKRPAKEVIESKPETPLISEKDVHRDSDEKYKKLQILLPKIQLRRFSGAELKNDTTENLPEADNNNTVEASDAKKVTKLLCHPRSCIKEQLSEKAGVVRGLKRRGKQQSTEDNSADKPSKMKCLPEKKVEVQSTSKLSNVNAEKLPFTERNSVQEQPKIENTKRPKTRGKLQLLEIKETKKLLPETSGIVDLPSVKVIPKSPTKNAASSKSEQPEDPAEKTENVVTRKSNRRGSQDLKSEVRDSVEVKKPAAPEATRRSKRTLAKKAIEETSPKGSKNAKKTIQRRKEVLKKTPVKKSILKKVIEKEVNAIESFEIRAEKAPENTTGASPAMSQTPNKIRVVTLTPEVMRKLKETVLKKTSSSTPNHIRLVVPPEVLCRIQNSATRGQNPGSPNSIAVTPTRSDPLSNLKVSVVPATTNVIRYGIEDLKRDQQKRREEKEKMAEKEKILKKMLVKFDEKEKKKQMKFCEKKLTRFLDKHREAHVENLTEKLLNIRSISLEDGIELLEEVKQLSCMKCKEVIGRTLCSLGFGDEKDLFIPDKAVGGLITLSTSKVRQRQKGKKAEDVVPEAEGETKKRPYNKRSQAVAKSQQSPKKQVKKEPLTRKKEPSSPKKEPLLPKKEPPSKPNTTGFSIIECAPNMGGLSYSNEDVKIKSMKRKIVPQKTNPVKTKVRRNLQRKNKQPFVDDPFVDVSIVTEEKFVMECPCMKLNCNGLHPENFLI